MLLLFGSGVAIAFTSSVGKVISLLMFQCCLISAFLEVYSPMEGRLVAMVRLSCMRVLLVVVFF